MRGKVWLVGAGPGDAGLMTIKGQRVLDAADVVVYDALVGQGISLPQNAEKIYVGKQSGNHALSQEKINELLLKKALLGKRVVRLKGGDPFLFGRGGEELELLFANGIEFEVVPGVTSAISVPAYSGIPVTHREFACELHIITAHRKQGEAEKIDYASLVALKNATLVFMMGVARVEEICNGLICAGMQADMPAAIIEKGTSHLQRKVIGKVSDLAAKAKEQNVGFPGIILVGKVCALGEKFGWAEKRPLGQTRVIVTRPKDKASIITEKLQELGATVLSLPTIETKNADVSPYLDEIAKSDWVLFTSISAVQSLFEALERSKTDIRKLYKVKIGVVGQGTANAILKHGVVADYMPKTYCAKALGQGLPFLSGEKIAIFTPKEKETECEQELIKRGAQIKSYCAYETIKQQVEAIETHEEDIAVFTSASSVKGFCNIMGDGFMGKAVCIGEQTNNEAQKHGMKTYVAKSATIDSLVEKVLEISGEVKI